MNNFVSYYVNVSFRNNNTSDIAVRGFYPVWNIVDYSNDILLDDIWQTGVLQEKRREYGPKTGFGCDLCKK